MKYFKIYLMITSVVLHIALIVFIIWAMPVFTGKAGGQWEQNVQTKGDLGVVADVSEIVRGENRYRGYLVKSNGKDLYLAGDPGSNLEKGDQVRVMLQEHPYAPSKSLMVFIRKTEK